MTKKHIYIVFTLLFIVNIQLNARINLIIGNAEFHGNLKNIGNYKFEQAVNFITLIKKDTLNLVPIKQRDSLIKQYINNNINTNLVQISKELNADYIVFAKINSLNHLIRTDLTLVNTNDTNDISKGIGYASANFITEKGDNVYDPAILNSVGRALAVALKDSNLLVDTSKGFNTKPAALLAIGGIYFADNEQLKKWFLFDKKVENSYDAVETIFSISKNNANFVTIDTETRDSIFSLDNLFIIENYSAPSEYELLALYKMGVEYYISGVLKRTEDGAVLELYLYKFENGVLRAINSAHETLTSDSIVLLRESLKFLTEKILK